MIAGREAKGNVIINAFVLGIYIRLSVVEFPVPSIIMLPSLWPHEFALYFNCKENYPSTSHSLSFLVWSTQKNCIRHSLSQLKFDLSKAEASFKPLPQMLFAIVANFANLSSMERYRIPESSTTITITALAFSPHPTCPSSL